MTVVLPVLALLDLDNEMITSNETSGQQSKCFPNQLMDHNTMDNTKCVSN